MTSSSKTNSPNYKRKTARIRIKSPTYVNLESSSKEHHNERTPLPPPRKKSTSSRSNYQTVSFSPGESPTPTHVALPPKLRVIITLKLEPQSFPPQQTPPHSSHISNTDNWPSSSSNMSPPPRFAHPPLRFKHPPSPQPLFVNIKNNAPQQEHLPNLPPNLGNQQLPNPHNNILDFVNPNDLPYLRNMFCQCCNTTRHEIHMLRERVKYMFFHIRHYFGFSSNPPYFPH
ncbi:hypothetical protein Tco_0112994 [Tanacetum coccineum]